ncbi:MAG: hypothetical protein V2A73_05155 [Pseudomonadota bacterium]
MQRTVQLFVIPADRIPGGPPLPVREMPIEASSMDGLREAAMARLTAEGFRVRSLSFGSQGLVAYVEERR